MYKKAFTLIEMGAVIAIILVILGISLPLMNRGTSHHEAKMVANSLKGFLSTAYFMTKAAGKVYAVGLDMNYSVDHENPEQTSKTIYYFHSLSIYSVKYNGKLEHNFCGETFEIPVSLEAYCNLDENKKPVYLYFKPDGSITASTQAGENLKIYIWPENHPDNYYRLNIFKSTGNIQLESSKDN